MTGDNKTQNTRHYRNIFILSFEIVFSSWKYILVAGAIASIFWVIFNHFDQLLFFSPIVIFYLPDDAVMGFVLSTITSILLGIVVSMNIYVLRHSKVKLNLTSFFSGSTVSVLSSTCASCSSLGFLLVSTLGGAGIAASTFLSNYQTPLRVLSLLLLLWALYSISNRLTKSCIINHQGAK